MGGNAVTVGWSFNGSDCTVTDASVLDVQLSHDGGASWTSVATSATPSSTSVTFDSTAGSSPDATTYQFRLRSGGRIIDTTAYSNVTVDNTAPSLTSINFAGAYTNTVTPTITLNGASDATAGLKDMAFSCDNITWSSFVPYAGTYSSFNVNTGAGCSS